MFGHSIKKLISGFSVGFSDWEIPPKSYENEKLVKSTFKMAPPKGIENEKLVKSTFKKAPPKSL